MNGSFLEKIITYSEHENFPNIKKCSTSIFVCWSHGCMHKEKDIALCL